MVANWFGTIRDVISKSERRYCGNGLEKVWERFGTMRDVISKGERRYRGNGLEMVWEWFGTGGEFVLFTF
jgi:hypothetical protein